MELNITRFFREAAPMDYSASVAEIGADAGRSTWNAACDDADEWKILDSKEKQDAFAQFVRESGGWSDDEVEAFSDHELEGLCIQWIAGDMREPVGFELGPNTTDNQWADYQKQCEAGQAAGRIFKGTDGEIYFYCGS